MCIRDSDDADNPRQLQPLGKERRDKDDRHDNEEEANRFVKEFKKHEEPLENEDELRKVNEERYSCFHEGGF